LRFDTFSTFIVRETGTAGKNKQETNDTRRRSIIHLGFFVMAVRHVISRAANSFILKQQQKQLQDAC
jgi:hypothetical protein